MEAVRKPMTGPQASSTPHNINGLFQEFEYLPSRFNLEDEYNEKARLDGHRQRREARRALCASMPEHHTHLHPDIKHTPPLLKGKRQATESYSVPFNIRRQKVLKPNRCAQHADAMLASCRTSGVASLPRHHFLCFCVFVFPSPVLSQLYRILLLFFSRLLSRTTANISFFNC
jgi:hypothetical protein